MTGNDVLTELDRFIAEWHGPGSAGHPLQRARDEIVALREKLTYADADYESGMKRIRAEAVEEAARVCQDFTLQQSTPDSAQLRRSFAAAIRALKDKP